MGRPPIGKMAMTAAERQRRHRAKVNVTKPVTKPAKPTDTADTATLSLTAQQKLEAAIRVRRGRLEKSYWRQVTEEVQKQIAAANDAVRENYKKVSAENLRLGQMLNKRGVFSNAEFKQLLMCAQEDSPASKETRKKITQLLLKNERRLRHDWND